MSDLIERNDAVEAIEFEKVYMTAYKGNSNGYVSEGNPFKQYNKGLDDAIKAINSLTPVKPERIIKIGKRSGQTLESAIDYLQSTGWLQEHDRILTESVKPQPRWIPVTEALPKNYEQTICIDSRGKMMIGMYGEYGWTFPCYMTEPVAWMPLPEPYRGG